MGPGLRQRRTGARGLRRAEQSRAAVDHLAFRGQRRDARRSSGEFTQVRLNDGTTGWVKSAYLTTKEPAVVRVKQLEEELDRSRATTPALAEAAARSEVEQLKRELAAKQSELIRLRCCSGGISTVEPAMGPVGSWARAGSGAADAGTLARAALSRAAACTARGMPGSGLHVRRPVRRLLAGICDLGPARQA